MWLAAVVASQPQRSSSDRRIDPGHLPPCGFIAMAVNLAMVSSAQRDGELVADLAAERPALREAQMMGIRRLPAADRGRAVGPRIGHGRGREPGAAPASASALLSIAVPIV